MIAIQKFCSMKTVLLKNQPIFGKILSEIFTKNWTKLKNQRESCKCHLIQYVRSIHVHFIRVFKIQDFYIHHHNQQLTK